MQRSGQPPVSSWIAERADVYADQDCENTEREELLVITMRHERAYSREDPCWSRASSGIPCSIVEQVEGTTLLTWVATHLSEEFSPSFKLLVDDPDMDEPGESQTQIFLATVTRNVRLSDGTRRTIRIPDTILRVRSSEDESVLDALGRIATPWDLF